MKFGHLLLYLVLILYVYRPYAGVTTAVIGETLRLVLVASSVVA